MDQVHLSSAGPPFLFSLRVALTALLAEQELIAPPFRVFSFENRLHFLVNNGTIFDG